ncbi:MAG: tetratricopeptide repeat protein [Bacteroidota bacterium]
MKLDFLLYFLLGIVLFSCNPQEDLKQKITDLEVKVEASSDNEQANELLALYQSYVEKYPEDHEMNGRYLYRATGLALRTGKAAEALTFAKQALKDHYSSSNSLKTASLLAQINKSTLRNEVVGITIDQAIDQAFPDAQMAIPAGTPSLQSRLDTLRLNIFNQSSYSINFQVANDYINSVEAYALVNPNAAAIPQLLFKAGEVARSIQTFGKAVDLLAWINDKYPDSKNNAQALFLRAFTLDDGLKEFDQAGLLYQEFIDKYPDDPFADDAKFSLDNLGKDVNELIDGFGEQ